MLEILIWITVGFISGSIPWSVIVGKLADSKDVRAVGDGNPGAANAWKAAGWLPGIVSLVLDIAKGVTPVYLAIWYLDQPSGVISHLGMATVALAPVVGHGWSPFLRFRGGKALAVSGGSWIAITDGIAFLVACVFLAITHSIQKNHAITVTISIGLLLPVIIPFQMQPYIAIFWIANLSIVIWKHRYEYRDGFIFRDWFASITKGS